MLAIHRTKIILLSLFSLFLGYAGYAQENQPLVDFKKFNFGFTVSVAHTNLQMQTANNFLGIDSLNSVKVKPFAGFGLAAIFNFKLADNFDLRIQPGISFAQRNVIYSFDSSKYDKDISIESAYIDIPLILKYKAKRHRNSRWYVLAGLKYTYDLASNIDAPRSLADPIVALRPGALNYELGVGVTLYYPMFRLSPELKISNSINNVLVKDGFIYTEAIDALFSRIITLSFNFE